MGHFRKAGTDILQQEAHTRRFKTWVYVADTSQKGKIHEEKNIKSDKEKF